MKFKKPSIFLGLLFGVLLISSTLATDQTVSQDPEKQSTEVDEAKNHVEGDGYGYGWGGHGGYGYGWGGPGGWGGWGGGGWGGPGGGWGGGGWGGPGGGWGGGGWGRPCRFGCCGYHRWGGCRRCCYSAKEARAFELYYAANSP